MVQREYILILYTWALRLSRGLTHCQCTQNEHDENLPESVEGRLEWVVANIPVKDGAHPTNIELASWLRTSLGVNVPPPNIVKPF